MAANDRSGLDAPILTVRNLQTAFFTDKETIRAVDGVNFEITSGETTGIVGESGSGKSVTARSIMGLVESPGHVLEGSSIRFNDIETVRDFAERFPDRTVDLTRIADTHNASSLFERDGVNASPSAFEYESVADARFEDVIGGYGAKLGLVDDDDCIFVTEGNPDDPESIVDGFVEITRCSGEVQRAMRGGRIAMVFQDPLTSLNPVYTVGNQIEEALELHQGLNGAEATQEAIELLEAVGIPDARRRVGEYPHQFSGGMRQRAVIAMALACDPEVLICDEPTTALDVTIQAQILDLLAELQEERDLGVMFITHDMGVIAEISDRVNVMYAGEVVETADVERLFAEPKHPYTQGLLRSIPGRQAGEKLETIEGTVPTPNEPATACRFAPRCPKAFGDCERVHPDQLPVDEGAPDHTAACLLYDERYESQSSADPAEPRSDRDTRSTRGDD
ncbi:ABC transporter ATP-binding protein [Haloterrigena alkaliphila]|uniref:Nickel import system ATP-binding protein NikD n=1 Tax=Haloterrigena alkaliphila TaxID=2816475 RepID=A0A8A2VC61_9EURY|nr:ABC transporter ATP-binding protein [Haloterrigena alkaliphila]QSW98034.1 ABC transporter ATP-binding protein [Haloterrigena alkaliphila]